MPSHFASFVAKISHLRVAPFALDASHARAQTSSVRIISGIRQLEAPFPASVVTIGNFDGVHLGHQALIYRLVEAAKMRTAPAVAITFEPHPIKVLHPERELHRIFDLEDLKNQMRALGVDALAIEPFSRKFSQLPPEKFVLDWIFKPFNPSVLVVGYDFSFGAHRQGSIDFLQERGRHLGFEVEVVAPVKVGDVIVSSTRIRQAVEAGDVELATLLLGRHFYITGLVEKGVGRGRTIGVPTANLRTRAEMIPARGVYAALAEVRGKHWPAAVNIGFNPTFEGAGALTVEAHLIGFPGEAKPLEGTIARAQDTAGTGDIYGENVRLDFLARLREEKKFSGVTELVAQIKNDLADAHRIASAALASAGKGGG
jgi:riboflavin kinase/FMN adenylyltransferase